MSKLTVGTRVCAYYGPSIAESLPSQSPAELIVVLSEQSDKP